MGWYMGSYKAKSVRVFESLGEKTERDSKATPISTIQGYGWLRRLRMVTETWVMASGDVDVGWSRLISVDVALWFSSGAAFHAFLSIFSASAVLHEANLLSLLTELLTLHHDAIPLFSGNVLIWTKKNHFDLGRNWNLWSNLQAGYLQRPLVCLANPEKKVTTHQFVPRHFRIRAMPPGRPETRELRRPCRFCDGKTGFSTMKEHKWTTNHPTSSRCLQTLLLVPKICNRPKIGFDFTLTSLGPWKATHRGAEGISLWLSAMTTTWAAASASHTWQESIGRARQWREKYLENVPIQWNSMQCNDMQSMQRNAKECKGVQWCAVKWSEIKKCISWKDLKGIDVVLCFIKWIQTRNGLQSKFIDMLSWFLFLFQPPSMATCPAVKRICTALSAWKRGNQCIL
jgi:hypothetical protein